MNHFCITVCDLAKPPLGLIYELLVTSDRQLRNWIMYLCPNLQQIVLLKNILVSQASFSVENDTCFEHRFI